MCRLFETILIEEGKAELLPYHNIRFNRSRCAIFGSEEYIDLEPLIMQQLPNRKKTYRCRVTYGEKVREIAFEPYFRREIKTVSIVHSDDIDYAYKYEDRRALNALLEESKTDEIIILKDGLVTDSSIANLVFRSNGKLLTPCTPLLRGTRRQALLDEGKIIEATITEEGLSDMEEVFFVNALRRLDPGSGIKIS